MELTVCICTRDRPAYVRSCLDGLARQTAPRARYEVLIVDSGSTGDTPARLRDLAATYGARIERLDCPGIALARDAGLAAARAPLVACIDDDAIPAPDWVAAALAALAEPPRSALVGGRILPLWEAPLPAWWPPSLRGVLSLIEHDAPGEYRGPALPRGIEPYAANMVLDAAAARAAGGFGGRAGRYGDILLSDEEVQLAWALQDAGHRVCHDPRLVVRHQIQASRLNPVWLLSRLYWQGASTVLTRRATRRSGPVWGEVPRRLAVLALLGPTALLPRRSTRLLWARWRAAYALGFLRGALGWDAARAAREAVR